MGWALDGGEDIGGDMATRDYLAEVKAEIECNREQREYKLRNRYLVVCDAPSNGHLLYLQDRSISKRGFWTRYKSNAYGFDTKSGAETTAKRFRYNNTRVIGGSQ